MGKPLNGSETISKKANLHVFGVDLRYESDL
ncbi:hypothetical protein SAMN05192588_0672 [Nonlabens sp. Hel1_33_55]|nr:hypothetical protein SAMN05192588_0672 [Nonlabens sp. Hel1_33_55]